MTLVLSLSDRAELELRQHAAAAGKEVSKYATELLEQAVAQLPSTKADVPAGQAQSIAERLAPLLQAAWAVQRQPPEPLRGDEAEVRRLVLEKYRKQGLQL